MECENRIDNDTFDVRAVRSFQIEMNNARQWFMAAIHLVARWTYRLKYQPLAAMQL